MEILHVDVNSAYLSWTAVHLLEKGGTLDIRKMCIRDRVYTKR